MANERKLTVKILSDASGMAKGMKDAEGASGSFGKSLGKAAGLAGGLLGVAGAADLMKDSVGAAMSDEKSVEGLAQQIKSLGGLQSAVDGSTMGFAESKKTMEDYIGKLSLAQGVADDELRPAMAQILRSTTDVGIAQENMGLAMDIAAAKGISVAEAADLMAKAQNGNTKGLKSLGIGLKDANGKALGLDEIFSKLHKTFDGAGEAAAQTGSGKMRVMAVAFDEMKEKIGYALLPIIEKLVTWITAKLIPAVEKLGAWFKVHVLPVLKVLADFIFQKVVPALHSIFDFLMDHKEVLIGIGAALAVILVPAFIAWAVAAGAAAIATIAAAAPVIALGLVIAALATGVVLAVKLIIDHWTEIVDFFQALPGKVLDFLKGLPDLLLDLGKKLLSGLLDGAKWMFTTGIYEYFIGIPLKILEWLGDLASLLLPVGKAILTGLWDGIKWVAENLLYQYFIGIPLKILELLKDANVWLFNKGKDILGGIVSGVTSAANDLWGWLKDLPGTILDKIGDGAGLLWDFGKSIVKGLVNGIIDAWDKVADFLKFKIGGGSFLGVDLPSATITLLPHLTSFKMKALGGPVEGGMPYIVGERGPELFMPGQSGSIVPNSALAGMGGGGTTNNFYITGAIDPDAVASQIQKLLRTYQRGLQ